MRLSYDTEADALAIFLEVGVVDRTIEVETGTMVDVDAGGRALTIEVLRPARPWPLEDLLSRFELAESDRDVISELARGVPQFDVRALAPLVVA